MRRWRRLMGMKQILVMMAAVVLVGCGGSKEKATPETQAKAETKKPEAVPVVTVTIDNPILENTIREYLDKPAAELTNADLEKVGELNFNNRGLTDAPKGLKKLTQLQKLVLANNKLTSVKGLEKLTKLEHLNLTRNQLTSVKGLEKLNQLKILYLYDNQLTDVTGLEKLTQLQKLFLDGNQLTDVTGLEKLTQLKILELNDNPDLTKAQIDELKKALPNCLIYGP
jgi:Leucine-rich repeat (LRR) protein